MALPKLIFARLLKEHNFADLFNKMGWDNPTTSTFSIEVKETTIRVSEIAQKSGFRILHCDTYGTDGTLFPRNIRQQIHHKVAAIFREHILIFSDKAKKEQIWQVAIRKQGQPTKIVETRYANHQDIELLYQKAANLFFKIDQEDNITIVDVTTSVQENFAKNAEVVTKKFYERFKKEHNQFKAFIENIADLQDKDWYASLMMNRLMFCYFIQKKGFLDNNTDYLRDKLQQVKDRKDEAFYSFYRAFLLQLFHQGLNRPQHSTELVALIGKVPYLNGGLFDEYELEIKHLNIQIPDEAFEKIFAFFDQYEWHLDTRPDAKGNEINPDVIGYIFEKYINDRAAMGAYYTKEDITDYIGKNCILPFLFDEVGRHYSKALKPDSELFTHLRESGDTYIYDAVKHGVSVPYPDEIAIGLDTSKPDLLERRKAWNKPAPSEAALPTEIWREVVERRRRYQDIVTKIRQGELTQINDFITYNLNIRQFAQDIIEGTTDADFLWHFYQALRSVTILDPTCGSGAFLFAALNILEPLYEAAIGRMRAFVEEEDQLNAQERSTFKNAFQHFRAVLQEVQNEKHPNLPYFIYKSTILNNLYGVDLMREAVEIAKLRLFLKLVATVQPDKKKPNYGLEPLPDIDFNIRAGNTLVGFATEKDLINTLRTDIELNSKEALILEQCEVVARAFERFKQTQLETEDDYNDLKNAKKDLQLRLDELNNQLNRALGATYGAFPHQKEKYQDWLNSHQPFHWFVEFYNIIHQKGGFDVIIGNPPYVEYSKVKKDYEIRGLDTISAGNIYAPVVELSTIIKQKNAYIGMIIPMSSICTDRSKLIQSLFRKFNCYISSYSGDRNPAEMFDGVKMRLTIFIISDQKTNKMFNTKYNKWYTKNRPNLIESIAYSEVTIKSNILTIPKMQFDIERSIYNKIINKKELGFVGSFYFDEKFYYHNAPIHWVRAFNYAPYFESERDGVVISSHFKSFRLDNKDNTNAMLAILNSSLFFYWFIINSNCRDLSEREINAFMFDFLDKKNVNLLSKLSSKLMDYYQKITKRIEVNYKTTGSVSYDQVDTKLAKPIIDEIDKVLAEHYGFTEEELDFIINYDIKYRMGKALEGGEGEEEE